MKISNKSVKIIISMLIILAIGVMMSSYTFAAADYLNPKDLMTKVGDDDSGLVTASQNIAASIIGVIQVVGITVAVIMLIIVAIKYLTASADGKAEIKKYAVGYIVGAVVLFGASSLLGLLKGAVDKTVVVKTDG